MIDVCSILRNELFLELDVPKETYALIFKEYAAKCERVWHAIYDRIPNEELTLEQEIERQDLIKGLLPATIAVGDILVIHPVENYFDAFFEHLVSNPYSAAFSSFMRENVANFSEVSKKLDTYFEGIKS